MRKTLLIVFASFLMLGVSAQNFIGVKAGGGLAIRSGNATFTTNPGAAIMGGLAYKHQILKRLILEGDVLMDIRMPTADLSDGTKGAAYSSTYVSVPITAQWISPLKGKDLVPYKVSTSTAYWYIEGGPYFGYGLDVAAYDPANATATASNIDVGLTGGAGMNFGFAKGMSRFSVGTRANYGLLNTYGSYDGAPTMTNLSIVGYVGLDFSLTKRKHIKHRW